MLKKFRLFALLLLLSIALAGCDGNLPENPPAENPPASGGEEEDGNLPENLFEIYRDGALVSTIIIPEGATSEEANLATRLQGAIFQRTRKQIGIVRDSEVENVANGAIIIGRTSLPESVAIYDELPVRSAVAFSGMIIVEMSAPSR